MLFGLIGKSLKHSYSKEIFSSVFKNHNYQLFEINEIGEVNKILLENKDLCGLNVTFPYKTEIIKYLSRIDKIAKKINAVNVIKIIRDNNEIILDGYNTDYIGFEKAYHFILKQNHKNVIILGTGSTAKTVSWVLKKYNLKHIFVSRTVKNVNTITYNDLSTIDNVTLIINATPVGTFNYTTNNFFVPQSVFNNSPFLIDLVYNPEITELMKYALSMNCPVFNGMSMLIEQAKESWKIWGLI
ncbi:MAG: shikimate dehydrogenase [Bacteroidales bacterium]|nr:shikimate dehydrogenase [Bacteroidales bacterium]